MTERFEVTPMLQRALVNDRAAFGEIVPGTEAEPSVYMESVHHLMKVVAGAPNIRPQWFFDTNEQGEAASDIGTHLVDLVQWTLFPGQGDRLPRRHPRARRRSAGRPWIPEADFRRVTSDAGVSQGAGADRSRTGGSSTTATRWCRTRCAASTRS